MIQTIKPDLNKDKASVIRGLSINISEALETGQVKDSGEELQFNNIDDPSTIVGRPADVFEAIDRQRALFSQERAAAASAETSKTE